MGRKIILLLAITLCPYNLFGREVISFELNHIPPEKPTEGEAVSIWVEVLPKNKVKKVYLYYRKIGSEKYKKQRMAGRAGRFYGVISADVVKEPGFEYFIRVIDVYDEPHDVFFSPSLPKKVLVGEVEEFEFIPALEEFAIFQEEEIVIAAAKKEQRVIEAPQTVSVISGKDLRRLPVISITEALRLIPGAEVFNVYPSFTVVGIRGFSDEFNNLIVLLLDGREMNVELFGAPLWEHLPIGVEDIERIEVIKGPGGSLYGPNAFSGVINIVTRGEKNKGFRFHVSTGAYPFTTRFHLSYANKKKSTFYLISFNHRQSYYFQQAGGNDLLNESLFFKMRSKLEDIKIYGDLDVSYGTGTYLEPFSVFREDPYISAHLRFGTEYKFLKSELWVSRTQWLFHPKERIFLDNGMEEISMSNNTVDVTLEGRWEHPKGLLIGGSDFRYNYYTVEHMGEAGELRAGIFLQEDFTISKWLRLNMGLRFDYNNQVQPIRWFDALSLRGSFIFSISEDHTVRVFGGRAFRKPSFLEYGLYFSPILATLPIYEPMLRDYNEGFISGEVNYSGKVKNLKWSLSVYYNLFQNAIGYHYTENRFLNLKFDSDAIGGEVFMEGVVARRLTLFTNYNYQLVRSKDTDEKFGIEEGKRVKNYPEHKLNVGFIFRPLNILLTSVTFSFVSERTFPVFRDPERNISDAGTPYKSYTVQPIYLLNFKIALLLRRERLEIGIRGYNILNRQHEMYPGEGVAEYIFGGEAQPMKLMGYIQGYF